MILVLEESANQNMVDQLLAKLQWMNLHAIVRHEDNHYQIAIVNGDDKNTDFLKFKSLPHVANILPFTQKYKLASREYQNKRTIIDINGVTIGGNIFAIMAGPCSIESEQHIHETAALVAAGGANILRGGAFKPRTSPYDFQGLGEEGLRYMQHAANKNNLLSVTEVMDTKDVDLVASYVDILQIGARNMQNFNLLKEAGKSGKPILLKRGLSATYVDLLMAAEYILQTGNPQVILCERGIRTFETYARNTLDIAAAPILQELSHLPVIIDPSHGIGIRKFVPPLAYAAIAAGANGIMVEVHQKPDQALSDGKQTITPETFSDMVNVLRAIGSSLNILV